MKRTILILLASVCGLMAQTPNTNDVATSWNVQFNYSTNQKAAIVWVYRNYTNSIPLTVTNTVGTNTVIVTNTIPTINEFHGALVKGMAANMADSYIQQRENAEQAVSDFLLLRKAWTELTPTQRSNVLNSAGVVKP